MSTRANPTVIGAFVLGAAVLLVAGLLVWGSTTWFETRYKYVMYFDSTVIGLRKGAAVTFRGVRVGDVTDVQVRWGTTLVAVYISLDPDNLKGVKPQDVPATIDQAIKAGLRAQLKTESLVTGVLFVALNPFPDEPLVLRGLDKSTPEIPTIPSTLEQVTARLEKVMDAVEALPLKDIAQATIATLEETQKVLRTPQIKGALTNAEAVLADTRRLVAHMDTLVRDVNAQVGPLSGDARATLAATQKALEDVPLLVGDARRLIVKVDAHADPLLASLLKSSDSAGRALDQARFTLNNVDGTLNQDSVLGYELVQMLRELRETSRALRSLADYLERMPDAPIYGVSRPAAVKGGS
ncbi:MAG TPA: MlaD family protein [Methylomirabilota bacterium]|nr:MlaD family protein [Methylomirabilota bacterium]